MTRTMFVLALTLVAVAGCGREAGPPVVISDVRILAPLTTTSAGVAYMTISNDSAAAITVRGVRSPQFEKIEIHETLVDEDGVSSMAERSEVVVDPGSDVRFAEGGLHLMLMGPRPDTRAGTPVTLEIELGDGLLIVSATLQNRLPTE